MHSDPHIDGDGLCLCECFECFDPRSLHQYRHPTAPPMGEPYPLGTRVAWLDKRGIRRTGAVTHTNYATTPDGAHERLVMREDWTGRSWIELRVGVHPQPGDPDPPSLQSMCTCPDCDATHCGLHHGD